MANIKSAKKAVRVSKRRNAINKRVKKSFREARKAVISAVESKDADAAKKNLVVAYSKIDFAVKKGVIHKNTGSRYKSRMALIVNKLNK